MKTKMQWKTVLVFACSMSVAAQTPMSSDASMKNDSMGKKMTITGCLSEKEGKYMLTDKKHADGIELMGTQDLKPHIGHKVSVTGMMQGDSTMSNEGMAMAGFRVTSMKMVSDKCSVSDSTMKK